jgi:acetyl-CoA acetyltransferase
MSIWDLKDQTAIAGVGNSAYGRRLMRSPIDLAADAIANALDDAGLVREDLDGLAVSFGSPIGADGDSIAPLLGLNLRAFTQTWAHGRFTASCIQWAAMMVSAGMATAVACLASVSFSGIRRPKMGGSGDREGAREGGGAHGQDPVYGMTSPGAGAALVARRYFERYGANSRQLAAIPIAFRKHAALNPNAIMREPIGVDDHQASRFVCEPLHLLDYCLINDGAACVIVTSADRARDLRKPPVYIAGMQPLPAGREEFIWAYPGFGVAQQSTSDYVAGLQPVYKMADITPDDLVFQLRRLLDPAVDRARALRPVQAGRGRGFHAGRTHRTRRRAADEHQRRPALRGAHHGLESSGGNRPAVARRMRSAPDPRRRDHPMGQRLRRLPDLPPLTQ